MWRSKQDSVSLPLSGCFDPVWSSPIPASSDYVDPICPPTVECEAIFFNMARLESNCSKLSLFLFSKGVRSGRH